MRIVAGNFKGTTLYGPKNKKIRPLKDMVRENIFNFLAHSNKISRSLEQSNVLDYILAQVHLDLSVFQDKLKMLYLSKKKMKH